MPRQYAFSASTSMSSSFSSTVGSAGTSFFSLPAGFFSSSAFFLAATAALRDASDVARRGKLLSSFPNGVSTDLGNGPPQRGAFGGSAGSGTGELPRKCGYSTPEREGTLGSRRTGIRRSSWDRGLGDTSNVNGPLRLGGRGFRWRDRARRWRLRLRCGAFGLGLTGWGLRFRGSRHLCGGRHLGCRISHLHVKRLARAICPGDLR